MNSIINWDDSYIDDTFFPIVGFKKGMITPEIYQRMKKNFPKMSKFKTKSYKQKGRLNIDCGDPKNLRTLKSEYIDFYNLYVYLSQKDFKEHLLRHFKHYLNTQTGFVGNLDDTTISVHIAESKGGYENPFHIDTRKRIVHGLLYFGKENITYGGQLLLGKYKNSLSPKDFPQYPKLSDFEKIKAIPPIDNKGLFVLSTPNSYHKGNKTQGLRRFIYISLDYTKGDAWKCGWNQDIKPFPVGIQYQHSEKELHKKIEDTIKNKNDEYIVVIDQIQKN